jgi:DNA repair exonuclease SbcCD ATPase subunit
MGFGTSEAEYIAELQARVAELQQPPEDAAWESVVLLAHKTGGDPARDIQSITGHYVAIRDKVAELETENESMKEAIADACADAEEVGYYGERLDSAIQCFRDKMRELTAERDDLRKRRDDLFVANNEEVERKRAVMRERDHALAALAETRNRVDLLAECGYCLESRLSQVDDFMALDFITAKDGDYKAAMFEWLEANRRQDQYFSKKRIVELEGSVKMLKKRLGERNRKLNKLSQELDGASALAALEATDGK